MKYAIAIFALLSITLLTRCTTAFIDESGTVPEVENITYENDIQQIMFNYCLTCHSGSNPVAGLNLSSYDQVRASTENGRLLDLIEDAANPMPPSGLMPAEERAKILKWVEEGFQ